MDRVTVKVAFWASSLDVVTSAIDSPGVSSSLMVRVAVASEIVALEAFDRVRVALSLASSALSANTGTVKVFVVSPGAKLRLPEVSV